MHKLNKSKERRVSRTYLGLGLIAVSAVVSGVVLSSAHTHAVDTVVDDVVIDVPLSCSVSASGMDSHTETIANGTYIDDIGTTYMNIACNDNAGFSIYATGFTGDQYGDVNSNKLVGAATGGTINTGTATSAGDPDVSNWAMKLEANAYDTYPITILSDYDYYHTVPGSYVKVATRLASTDVGEYAEGATLTSTYAAYISKTQGADTYSGKVKYVLVHPNTAPAPVTLYLQNTNDIAAAVHNIGDTATAIDQRDGTEYMVGKLADGNIWLLDNLALDLTAADASTTITTANTNASATSLNALFNGVPDGGQDGNLAHAAVINSYWDFVQTEPVISTIYNGETMSDVTNVNPGDYGVDWPLGVYYNFCAASAGSYCHDEYPSGVNASEDICPAGWRMPTGGEFGEQGEYETLYDAYGYEIDTYTAFINALRTPLAGTSNPNPGESYLGFRGFFWASTMYSGNTMYILDVDHQNYINPNERDSGFFEYSVRCIMSD